MLFRRAIVIGGSVAGLLAARVLSSHFEQVHVLEGDVPPSLSGVRKGVPHGKQTHVLLPSGAAVVRSLFPGRIEELVASGAKRFDFGHSRYHLNGLWMPDVETGLSSYALTRRLFEDHLRRWVSLISNVKFSHGTKVSGLCCSRDNRTVTGVLICKPLSDALPADLVIDASGRNSAVPRYLRASGIANIPQESVYINMGYATGLFRTPPEFLPQSTLTYIVGRPPLQTRAGNLFQVEDGLICSGMAGYHGDYPPGDISGFLDFAKSLPESDIYEVLKHSELVSPIACYRAPASVRRYYGQLKTFPNGLLPIGDAVSSFDPVFAQGMSLAAQEAAILDASLKQSKDLTSLRKRYLSGVDARLNVPWDLCCGENFKYDQTPGRRPKLYQATRAAKDVLGTSGDPVVARELYKVFTLTASPLCLLKPNVVLRALAAHMFASSSAAAVQKLTDH